MRRRRHAAAWADVLMILAPDEHQAAIYADEVAGQMKPGSALAFAHGLNIHFGLIDPPANVDVVMVAPRMIGPGVRDTYVSGEGFPSFVGIHQDASGRARDRMLALAHGLGSTRAGCIEMSFHDEASLDLFTEQGFGPAFGRVLTSAIELLVEAGYPPEAVLLELYLSGEFAYSFEKMREVGMMKQMDFHSQTSQYGTVTGSARFMELGKPIKEKMSEVLDEIRSGRFANEWSENQTDAKALFEKIREARDKMPVAKWDQVARTAFRIGDAG